MPRRPSLSFVASIRTGSAGANSKTSGTDSSLAVLAGVDVRSPSHGCDADAVTQVRITLVNARRTTPRATLARVTRPA
jgi:hypothetical protein